MKSNVLKNNNHRELLKKGEALGFSLFLKGPKLSFCLIIGCLVFSTILGGMTPHRVSLLVKNYDLPVFYTDLQNLALLFLGLFINRVIYQWCINFYMRELLQNLRTLIYEKWLLSYQLKKGGTELSERYPQGEVMARVINDTLAIRELLNSGTFGIIIDFFFVISCLIGLIRLNTVSGVSLLILEVIACTLLIFGSKYMRKVFHLVRKKRGEVSAHVAGVVGGLSDLYFSESDRYAEKTGSKAYNEFLKSQLSANVWDASYYSFAESLYPVLLALIVLIFPYSKITEAAVIFAIIDLIQRSIDPIKSIAGKIANIQRAVTGIDRLNEFTSELDTFPATPLEREDSNFKNLQTMSVEVEKFSYPNKDGNIFSLVDISFKAKKGELVGIVGKSGSGKSTLLKILAGQIIPKNGSINLQFENGEVSFPPKDWQHFFDYRELVALVTQDGHVFGETVAFNISFHKDRDKLESFWNHAVEKLGYLKRWGISLNTVLEPSGLSLGQSQLIIALRASYLKRPVVFFDEISSGMDSELEEDLRKLVLDNAKNSLTFIVAHRIETILKANQILVIDGGHLVGKGQHSELLEQEIYKDLIHELYQ